MSLVRVDTLEVRGYNVGVRRLSRHLLRIMSTTVGSPSVGQVEVPSQSELIWALSLVMDGVKEHDIPGMTGLSYDQSSRLYDIASRAIKVSRIAYEVAAIPDH